MHQISQSTHVSGQREQETVCSLSFQMWPMISLRDTRKTVQSPRLYKKEKCASFQWAGVTVSNRHICHRCKKKKERKKRVWTSGSVCQPCCQPMKRWDPWNSFTLEYRQLLWCMKSLCLHVGKHHINHTWPAPPGTICMLRHCINNKPGSALFTSIQRIYVFFYLTPLHSHPPCPLQSIGSTELNVPQKKSKTEK